MGKSISKPTNGKKPRPQRPVVVSDVIRIAMADRTQKEKDKIEAALKSERALLRLPVEEVVAAESGDMYSACVTKDLRLIYQIYPDRIEVVLLLSAGASDWLRGRPPRTTPNKASNDTP